MTGSDHAEVRSARPRLSAVRPRHVVAVAVIVTLATLLGLYREAVFLSHFGITYLKYIGAGDIGLGSVDLLATVVDVRFVTFFVILAGALTALLVILYTLRLCVAAVRRATSLGRPYLSISDAMSETLAKRFPDEHSFAGHLRRYVMSPYRLGTVLTVAALLAINLSTSAEQDAVDRLAEAVRAHDSSTDATALRRATPSDYRLVSVQTQEPRARLDNLIDLGSSRRFLFYYDAMAQKPVVMPKSNVVTVAYDQVEQVELAIPDAPDAEVNGALPFDDDSTTRGAEPKAAGDPGETEPQADVSKERAVSGADGFASSGTIPASADEVPSAVNAGGERTEPPAGSDDGATSSDNDGASGVTAVASEARTGQVAAADADIEANADTKKPGPAEPGEGELAEIQPGFEKSRDSLVELKQRMSALEGRVSEVNNVVGQLDAMLSTLDQLSAELPDKAAVADHGRSKQGGAVSADMELASYTDCPEVDLAQPIRFGVDQTSLDFEAIGVLFQAREQLTVGQRSADRQGWLVLEGHDDTAGSTARNLALAGQRAESVRNFLRRELGVPDHVLKVVALGGTGPEARHVRIYDCRDRSQPAAGAPSGVGDLGLAKTAAASEKRELPAAEGGGAGVGGGAADEPEVALADPGAREIERGLLLTVPGDLLWETNSDRVLSSAESKLAEVASVLERYATRRAVIVGHSDAYGERDYNRWLSERRAQAVRQHLIDRYGIDGDRLEAQGMGEEQPIASNRTAEGRRANRRVEIRLLE